jgi:hypothetical protein
MGVGCLPGGCPSWDWVAYREVILRGHGFLIGRLDSVGVGCSPRSCPPCKWVAYREVGLRGSGLLTWRLGAYREIVLRHVVHVVQFHGVELHD